MSYAAYRKSTAAMAAAVGGSVVSLSGGCHGVLVPVDGANLILARDSELGWHVGTASWAAWLEDLDGEKLTGEFGHDLGLIRPRDYSTAVPAALALLASLVSR